MTGPAEQNAASTSMRVMLLVGGGPNQGLLGELSRLLPLGGSELVLVWVRGPGPRGGLELLRRRPGGRELARPRAHEIDVAELEGGAASLQEAMELARLLAASAESLILDGDAGPAVCDAAARSRANLVVISAGGGDHPLGPKSLGPTARFIVDHSPCPVLLLRYSR